ncbi:MAG: AbrB/MazE/SpoVT family DNA-binding domain-containing protein [Candidatus Thermoplasmatota archaeon]|nr:AbrB/MazE/SpoVT family DNA-binding domain-containing protein [Candidatus Thermoplasmatota archaeon]
MEEAVVKIGERGQMVIPASMRKREGFLPNTYVRVIELEGKLLLAKVEFDPIDELIEAVKKLDLSDIDWAEIERERDGDR